MNPQWPVINLIIYKSLSCPVVKIFLLLGYATICLFPGSGLPLSRILTLNLKIRIFLKLLVLDIFLLDCNDVSYLFVSAYMDSQTAEMQGTWEVMTPCGLKPVVMLLIFIVDNMKWFTDMKFYHCTSLISQYMQVITNCMDHRRRTHKSVLSCSVYFGCSLFPQGFTCKYFACCAFCLLVQVADATGLK